ncbi:MAG: TetR/AcrR family transcriptional regulator [Myxococcales bacterium]|nr:MAG: TetR/AcrR family transcriptional regulator [Myxococcales bacterium]
MEPVERKQSILQAAKKVFALKGYHAAGVADIIEEAGIARGTFYLYFESKRDVFNALIEYVTQSISERLEPIQTDKEHAIYPALFATMERIKAFFFSDPDLAKIFLHEATALDASAAERLQDLRHRLVQWLATLVRKWQEQGILRAIDAEIAAYCFIGSIRELFEQYLITGYLDKDSSKIVHDILDLYVFGILMPEFDRLAQDHFKTVSE